MGAFSDYVSADAPAAPAAPDETLGDFSGGLRRGLRSGGAAFNRVAGTAAEAMGFDGFARGRIAAAQAADAENAADPAKVSSYKDVIGAPDFSTGLRRAVDYGSNMLGESVPALGAMAVGGALGGMRGAAAGMLPFSMGDVAARQEADPVASQESAGLRLGKQALFGGADAVLNTIVPASVASRVVGKAATAAAQLPVSQILGRVGADAVAQGAAGAAGEAVKQVGVNPTKTLDMDQIGEVAVGGTALGAAMGGVGAAGTLARKAAGAPGRAVGDAVDAVGASAPVKALKDAAGPEGYDLGGKASAALGAARDKAAALMPGADGGIDLGGIAKGVRDTAADAAEKSTDYFKSVAEGKEDLNPLKGKTPEEVLAMMPGLDAERAKRVAEAATDVLNSAISPETRKAVSAAAANAADKASQQIIASAKLAKDAAVDLGQKLDAGLKAMAARKPATDLGVKKSEDYSGLRAAINEHVIPALPRSALLGLDAPSTNKLINQAGDLVRMLLEAAARKNEAVLPDGTLQYVMDVFGDKTPQVLAAVYKATRSDPRTSPAEANAVFGTINRIREMQKSQADLADVLSKNVREELQDSVTTGQVKRDAMWLRKYVEYAPKSVRPRDKGGKSTTAEAMSEEERFNHAEIRDHFEARYGKNFEVVLAAAEKEFKATQKTRNQFDDGSETVDGADRQLSDEVLSEDADPAKRKPVAQTPDPVYRGEGGKDEFMLLAPEKAVGKGGFASATQQAIDAMTARYPDRNVTFLRASEIGDHPAKTATLNKLIEQSFKDHPEMSQADRLKLANEQLKDYGFVVAEGSRQETSMTERDLKGVKLKRPEGSSADYKHPSRIDVGGEVLDAIKLSKWAEARNKDVQDYSNADNKSGLHRAGRMFMEGLAAAHARIGKPMKSDTIPDATQIGWHADGKTPLTWGEVKGLDYSPEKSASTKAFEARLAALREEYKNGDEYERAATLRKVRDLHDQEVGGRDETRRWRGDDRYDADGRLTDEGARVLMQGDVDGGMEVERKTTHTDSVDEDQKVYTSEAITRAYLKDRGKSRAQREANKEPGDGRTEVDPFGPTHDVLRGRDEVPGAEIRTNLTGNSRQVDEGLGGSPMPRADAGRKPGLMSDATKQLLIDKVEAMQRNYTTAAGQAVAKRALALMDRIDSLPPPAHRALVSLLAKGTKMSDVAEVVNRLMPEKVEPKPVERRTPEAADKAKRDAVLDKMLAKEDYSALTTTGKTNAFLKRAYERYGELMAMGDAKWDNPAFDRLAHMFDPGTSNMDLASLFEDFDGIKGGGMTDAEIRAKLKAAAPEVAANLPKAGADRQAAVRAGPEAEAALDQANYSSMTKSRANVDPNASPRTAQQDAALNAYLDKVLGPSIARDLNANIPHAGEFVKAGTQHLINISRFAMDPWGTGHHEALHSFFASMREASPTGEVARVLERAASSTPVLNQLRKLLKDHPEALKQLSDPEEAAAYMYQFWAAGKLTVGSQTHTIFSRIAAAVRRVLGIWSNDERALHILDYFHRGDFAVDRGQPDVVAQKLLLEHRNVLVDQAAKLTKPLRELSSSVAVAGGQQLRDSGIPALAQLADVIKLHGTSEGKDPGYMPAARAEHTRVMNEVMDKLAPFTAAQMREALDAMQQGVKAVSKEARQIQLLVQNPKVGLLPKMREYMGNAGVDVSQFGPDPTYFHRVWDTGFIAAHEKEFMAMLGKYQISGDLKGDPRVILQNLMATDGLEFRVETNMPGMQALKMRKLGFITGADAEPFLRKDLLENLNSYVQQATRRAEWARRLGDQGEGLQDLLTKAAKQGATPEQLAVAQRYVKSIDGTLGDTIDPKYRRLFGNMMVYQNIRLLPLAIFSSLPDSLGIMVRGGTVAESGRAFLRGMREIRKNFQKEGGKNDAATDLAELIGTIDSAQLMHTIGTSYSQGMVGNTGRRVNDLFFRFNFMDQYNRSMRVAATEAAISFIKRHADGKANKHSERWLAEIGLEAGAVKLDAEGRPDVTDPDVRMAINRWVDGAVLRPDAADAPPWMADPRAALIAHLKKFAFSFQETILKRVAHEYRHGNYAPAMALTSYVPMMLAADMAKGIIQGGGEEPDWKAGWDVGDYLGHAVQRAGLFGVGQFALDTYQGAQRDGPLGALGALGGPTVGQLTDGVEMLAGTQRPGTFLLNSMPANALYSGMARDSGGGSGLGAGHNRP